MVVAPDRGEDLIAAADPAGVPHQVGEQLRLAVGEPDRVAISGRLASDQIEPNPARLQSGFRAVARLAQAGADAGQELVEGKWLGDVVGGSKVEPLDPIGDLGHRGQAGSPATPASNA